MFRGRRPLKRWRYVAFFGAELMACVATVRIGPVPDAFWAVLDRGDGRLRQGSGPRAGRVRAAAGRVLVQGGGVELVLEFAEQAGVEAVCPTTTAHAWTRKQAGAPATATVRENGRTRRLSGHVIVDDTAAYYDRHTRWRWSAGVGRAVTGAAVAWNLVAGVNDPECDSERTVWVDGTADEAPPVAFAEDLSAVGSLRFAAEAELRRNTNYVLLRSAYRQPFGTFMGHLPGLDLALAEGLGVMEDHDVWW